LKKSRKYPRENVIYQAGERGCNKIKGLKLEIEISAIR